MGTNYDGIAEEYRRAKQQPWRTCVESFTLMNLVGDISNRAVVDLGCGEGFYTRRLRHAGASRVVGVDLSEKMIGLARGEEDVRPLGIEYQIQDGRHLRFNETFDLAVAAYLLNYAKDRRELESMARGIAVCLKPGGRFVTVNSNPSIDFEHPSNYRKYGFEVVRAGDSREGTPIRWTFHLEDKAIEIENYHLEPSTYESVLSASGFREVRWHRPRLDPEVMVGDPPDHWSTFLEHPPIIFLECLR